MWRLKCPLDGNFEQILWRVFLVFVSIVIERRGEKSPCKNFRNEIIPPGDGKVLAYPENNKAV